MTIGEKIYKIRKSKGLSQDNLNPKNQSLVSQIESNRIKTPSEQTLKLIADNMDMYFDELIADTTWEPIHQSRGDSGIAISQTDFSIKLEKNKSFTIKRQVYPRYDINGNENKYCPKTGTPLLTACKKCKKPVNSTDSIYCMGCGNQLFYDFKKYCFVEQKYLFDALWEPEKLSKVGIKDLEEVRLNPYLLWLGDGIAGSPFDDVDADLFDEADTPRWSDEEIEFNIQSLYNNPKYLERMIPGADKWTADEFKKGVFSSIPEIVEEHITWKAKLVFAREYIIGLDKIKQLEEDPRVENIDNLKNTNKLDSKIPL